ncbi:MAG: hypothetical protein OXC46_00915 [Thaumarchaeota archaeon]|nr:hypothetical protein [Nitrososphaerota archaeon]
MNRKPVRCGQCGFCDFGIIIDKSLMFVVCKFCHWHMEIEHWLKDAKERGYGK